MLPQLSQRVRATDAPIIVKTKQFIGSRQDVLSLAQGALSSPASDSLQLPVCSVPLALFWRHRSMAFPRCTHDLVSPQR